METTEGPENIEDRSPVNVEIIRHIILGFMVITHTMIAIVNFLFILLFALGKHNSFVDFIAICTVISFLLFAKCVFYDVYYKIKGDEIVPDYAKDNYFRNKLQKFLKKSDKSMVKDLTEYRLDILDNTKPLMDCENHDEFKDMFNFKVQYLTISIILCVLLMIKYDIKIGIPFLVIWFFSVFKV